MVIVMDMQTGKGVAEPGDPYGEEVLNANWLPGPGPRPGLEPGLQHAEHGMASSPVATQDVEAFLSAVYRYQE